MDDGKPSVNRAASELYDRYYFSTSVGDIPYGRDEQWLNFFGQIADRIVEDIAPKTVLDAGCAHGLLVESLRDRGVEAFGVDVSEFALAQVREDVRPFVRRASVTDPLPQEYDLIICMEVLEHLPAAEAEAAVANLCSQAREVLFSSTPLDYGEVTHFNVQPPEYWATLFARNGFLRDVDYDAATLIAPWAGRFRRSQDPLVRVVSNYERVAWRLRNENFSLRRVAVEDHRRLASVEGELASLRERNALLEREYLASQTYTVKVARDARLLLRRLLPRGTRRGAALTWTMGLVRGTRR